VFCKSVNRMKSLAILSVLAALSAVRPSYGSHHFPDYPVRSASEYPNKVAKAGIVVAVEPVDDEDQQKIYFNSRLSTKGILAVFLVVENTSGTDTYLFDKSAAGLAEPVSGGSSVLPVGSGGLVDLTMVKQLTDERENMMKREARSKALTPRSALHGFLYVPVPPKKQRGKVHLQIPLTNAGSGEIEMVNLVF